MTEPSNLTPPYLSPLTDNEHAQIGRIAILSGQIEWILDGLIPHVTGLSTPQLRALNLTDKSLAAKAEFLKVSAKSIQKDGLKTQIFEFVRLINETKNKRNHAFHGVWGWRGMPKTKTVEPCARNAKNPSQPLRIQDLVELEKQLCHCANVGFSCFLEMVGRSGHPSPARFLHAAEQALPKWMHKWRGGNPVNDELLDKNYKLGELPRLSSLLPKK